MEVNVKFDQNLHKNFEVGMFIQILSVNRSTGELNVQTNWDEFIGCPEGLKKLKEEIEASYPKES